jgi:hypothetical protein
LDLGPHLAALSLSAFMEILPGKCLIPWRIFSVLPVVRTIAPNATALVALRQQLQAAGAITAQRMIDVALAEPVVTRLRRGVAPGLQPQRQSAKPPASKAASTMAAQPRRIPQPRLASGFAWPDGAQRHHA